MCFDKNVFILSLLYPFTLKIHYRLPCENFDNLKICDVIENHRVIIMTASFCFYTILPDIFRIFPFLTFPKIVQ